MGYQQYYNIKEKQLYNKYILYSETDNCENFTGDGILHRIFYKDNITDDKIRRLHPSVDNHDEPIYVKYRHGYTAVLQKI